MRGREFQKVVVDVRKESAGRMAWLNATLVDQNWAENVTRLLVTKCVYAVNVIVQQLGRDVVSQI